MVIARGTGVRPLYDHDLHFRRDVGSGGNHFSFSAQPQNIHLGPGRPSGSKQLGPPAVPFYSFLGPTKIDVLKKIGYRLILTSLLEDLDKATTEAWWVRWSPLRRFLPPGTWIGLGWMGSKQSASGGPVGRQTSQGPC